MLNEKLKKIVAEYEEKGVEVVVLNNNGKIEYSTDKVENKDEYCDDCPFFSLVPDPDPYDWFRDGDQKAICFEMKASIAGGLERPSEWTNIPKPLFCPKLNRKLTEEEKEKAERLLEWGRKRFN